MFRLVLAALVIVLALRFVQAASPLDQLRPFLAKHCYECHAEVKPKGTWISEATKKAALSIATRGTCS